MSSPVTPLALGAAITYVQTTGTNLDFLTTAEMASARNAHERHVHRGSVHVGIRADHRQRLPRMCENVIVYDTLLTFRNTSG